MNRTKLFCLPFAGGSKYSYREYEKKMPANLEMVCLEYPGRGSRSEEPLVADAGALADDLFAQLSGNLNGAQYAIYGHSMGALLACLLVRKIAGMGQRLPVHLFITGCEGPSATSRAEETRHLLDKSAFYEELRSLDGCPEEILNDVELLEHFEPILRSDFKASETYVYAESEPLDIPFTVITGTEEKMEAREIELWQRESRLRVDFRRMPGNHFFIFDHTEAIIKIITEKLFSNSKIIPHDREIS